MKIKNKGKVYPSPSSSSSTERDFLSVLKLLPAAIIALTSLLSLEDREVLAYMITRSIQTSNPSSFIQHSKKKPIKKSPNNPSSSSSSSSNAHKSPMFNCDCFDCYTNYWFKWDSSPNRELIHQAIEAFEDQLTHGEKSKNCATTSCRGKRREKISRRISEKPFDIPAQVQTEILPVQEVDESCTVVLASLVNDDVAVGVAVAPVDSSTESAEGAVTGLNEGMYKEVEEATEEAPVEVDDAVVVVRSTAASHQHKGLARKVLPDVLGIFNSRLWSLWSPNV